MSLPYAGFLSSVTINHSRIQRVKDIIAFLDSFRKSESIVPLHKWIGTYNIYREHLVRFFKWLHYPDIQPKRRPKSSLFDNIPEIKRKKRSIYRASQTQSSVLNAGWY
jgi:hypothetical protein